MLSINLQTTVNIASREGRPLFIWLFFHWATCAHSLQLQLNALLRTVVTRHFFMSNLYPKTNAYPYTNDIEMLSSYVHQRRLLFT